MARPRGTIDVVCPNPECSHYRREKGKDIIKKGRNSSGTQMYYCFYCRKYFVQTSDTPMYRKRLSVKRVEQLCRLLVEKNGIRAIHRITGLNKNTVSAWIEDLAEHAIQVQNYLVNDLELSEYECDELWTTVKKTKRNLSTRALNGLDRVKSGYIHA
jgi:transposase-like protein